VRAPGAEAEPGRYASPPKTSGGRPPVVPMGGLRAVLHLRRRHAHRRHHAEPARCL